MGYSMINRMKRRYNNQGCQQCGKPHTACREDDEGIMQCKECQSPKRHKGMTDETLKRRQKWRDDDGTLI